MPFHRDLAVQMEEGAYFFPESLVGSQSSAHRKLRGTCERAHHCHSDSVSTGQFWCSKKISINILVQAGFQKEEGGGVFFLMPASELYATRF